MIFQSSNIGRGEALLVFTLINFFFFSTMTSWTKDGEIDAYCNMLEKVHVVNCVFNKH